MFKVFALRLLLDGVAGIKFLLEGGFGDFTAVVKAHFYFYRNIPKLKQKRKLLKQNKVSQVYEGNIVVEHYLKRKKKFSDLKM